LCFSGYDQSASVIRKRVTGLAPDAPPFNITDNLVHEVFRGVLYFAGARMFLDANRHLYGLSPVGQTSASAFQKSPPTRTPETARPTLDRQVQPESTWSGRRQPLWALSVGAPYSNYVLYRATARSPQCASGIAAMRVYISPTYG